MKSALKPLIEKVEKSLDHLESALDKRIAQEKKVRQNTFLEPQLDLVRNEGEVTKKIASKLDETIRRLETLLSAEDSLHG